MDKLFEISGLRCSYDKPYIENESRVVLEIKELVLPKDKMIFIVGESGIGKSTVLEALGLMNNTIVPDKDSAFMFYGRDGRPVDLRALWEGGKDDVMSAFRSEYFSFIFQSTNLMDNFTAYENVALAGMLQGCPAEEAYAKTAEVLSCLDMGHISRDCMVRELSGGQRQRLAFARAVLPEFLVLFGDEPTGNLDNDNASRAMTLLTDELGRMKGASAVIVSHDMRLAVSFADIIVKISKKRHDAPGEGKDISYYGFIDSSCVYSRREDCCGIWTNGTESYRDKEFGEFLTKSSNV